jgi:SAM-dependent methyltransferase
MPQLPLDKIEWKAIRSLDPVGRVFSFEGEFYRAVYPQAVAHVNHLFERGIVESLAEKRLLIETKKTNLTVEGFGLVLHHRRIPFLSGAWEWSRFFVKAAALKVLELNRSLLPFGMGTLDYHSANIHQQGRAEPVWIDFGSIVPLTALPAKEPFAAEFRKCYLFPLLLYRRSPDVGRIVRAILGVGGLDDNEFGGLLGPASIPRLAPSGRAAWLDAGVAIISGLELPAHRDTTWSEYHPDERLSQGQDGLLSGPRQEVLFKIIRERRPSRVVDLGCNAGAFTLFAAQQGAQTYGTDFDDAAIERLHAYLGRVNDPLSITVTIRDLVVPQDRIIITGDFALALALEHHMALAQNFPFSHIAKIFASYTTATLLTEFMPNGMGGTAPKPDPLPSWYTLENFMQALKPYFSAIEPIHLPVVPGVSQRIPVLCTGRRSE